MSAGEMAYLTLIFAAFGIFAVSLIAKTHGYN